MLYKGGRISLIKIFLDECGYTGSDLLNEDQPIFTIATHNIKESECLELKNKFFDRIKASELKHVNLGKRSSQQNMVIDFLKYITKNDYKVKTSVIHKKYVLVCKMVDMIETALNEDGVDLYDKGGNIALANVLFYCFPVFGGEDFFNSLLLRFQRMMRNKDKESYDSFFKPIFNYYDDENLEELLIFFRSIPRKFGYEYLKYIKNHNHLDISLTSALMVMGRWRYEVSDEIKLIHDRSTNMSKQENIWDALVDPNLPNKETGYDRRRLKFPIAVSRTKFESSKRWVGLQLADIIAGATTRCFNWIINGKNPNDDYANEISQYIFRFIEHQIWPEPVATPAELETEGENAANPIDFVRQVTKDIN